MIERWVLIKLKEEFSSEESKLEVASHSREVLAELAGVKELAVSPPADQRSARDWDLSIRLRFATLEDVARYVDDPGHRAFVDRYLSPKLEVIKAWNFEAV